MTRLAKVVQIEAKLFFRDPAAWPVALLLPGVIMLLLGAIPALRAPTDAFGGQRFVDYFAPSLAVMTIVFLGINWLPLRLATYREKGVLRRLSTTPLSPAAILAAQLAVTLTVTVVSIGLLVAVGAIVYDVPLPRNPAAFVVAFLVGTAAVFALGMLVAAVAPNSRAAATLALPVFFAAMFFGGVYLPRFLLPALVVRLGDYFPPGVQGLLDAWRGSGLNWLAIGTMALLAVAAAGAAARLFRWE
jgi:ABC-2 type transport system permease protein